MYYAKTEATMNLDDLKAYKLVRKENLSDIRSTGSKTMMTIKYSTSLFVLRQRTAPVLHTFWNTVYFADPEIFL